MQFLSAKTADAVHAETNSQTFIYYSNVSCFKEIICCVKYAYKFFERFIVGSSFFDLVSKWLFISIRFRFLMGFCDAKNTFRSTQRLYAKYLHYLIYCCCLPFHLIWREWDEKKIPANSCLHSMKLCQLLVS